MVIGTAQKPLVAWLVNTHGVISCVNTDTTGNVYSFLKHNKREKTLKITDAKHYMKLLTDSLDIFDENAANNYRTIRIAFPPHLGDTSRHDYIVSIWNCLGGPNRVDFSRAPYNTLVRAVRGGREFVRGNRRIDALRNNASSLIMDNIDDYIRRMIFDRRKAMRIEDIFEHKTFVDNLDEANYGINMCCMPTNFELALRWQSRCNSNASSIMARLTEHLKKFVNRKKFIDSPSYEFMTEIADDMDSALQALFCEFTDDNGALLKCKTNNDTYSVAMSCLICALYASNAINRADPIQLSEGEYINYKNYKELYLMFDRLGNNELIRNLLIEEGGVNNMYKPVNNDDEPYDFAHPPGERTEETMETQFAKCLSVWFYILFLNPEDDNAQIQFSENSIEDDDQNILELFDTTIAFRSARKFFRLENNPWIYLTEFPVYDRARKDFRTGLYHLLKGGPRTNLANSLNPIEAMAQKAKQARFSMDPLTISYRMPDRVYPLCGASKDMPFIALPQLGAEVNNFEQDAWISIGGMPCVRPQEGDADIPAFRKRFFSKAIMSGLLAMITEARILLTISGQPQSRPNPSPPAAGGRAGGGESDGDESVGGESDGDESVGGESDGIEGLGGFNLRDDDLSRLGLPSDDDIINTGVLPAPPTENVPLEVPPVGEVSSDARENEGEDGGGGQEEAEGSPFMGITDKRNARRPQEEQPSDSENDISAPIPFLNADAGGMTQTDVFGTSSESESEDELKETVLDLLERHKTTPRSTRSNREQIDLLKEELQKLDNRSTLEKLKKKISPEQFNRISALMKSVAKSVIYANREYQVEKYVPNRIALPSKGKEARWLFQFGVPVRYVYMNDDENQNVDASDEQTQFRLSYTPPDDVPIFHEGRHYLNKGLLRRVDISGLNLLGMNRKEMPDIDFAPGPYNVGVFGKRTVAIPRGDNLRGNEINVLGPIDGTFSRAIYAARESVACFSLSLPPRLEEQMRRTTDRPLELVRRMLLSRYRQSPETWPLKESKNLRLDRFSINQLAAIVNNRNYIRRVGECDKASKYL